MLVIQYMYIKSHFMKKKTLKNTIIALKQWINSE